MSTLQPILFNLLDAFLRLTGLRDRLRCPNCRAVGTYKPHGSLWDESDRRRVNRWLCKWCGFYNGPEGPNFACIVMNREHGTTHWVLEQDVQPHTQATLGTPRGNHRFKWDVDLSCGYGKDPNPWGG